MVFRRLPSHFQNHGRAVSFSADLMYLSESLRTVPRSPPRAVCKFSVFPDGEFMSMQSAVDILYIDVCCNNRKRLLLVQVLCDAWAAIWLCPVTVWLISVSPMPLQEPEEVQLITRSVSFHGWLGPECFEF